jgi:hypothetical protein
LTACQIISGPIPSPGKIAIFIVSPILSTTGNGYSNSFQSP